MNTAYFDCISGISGDMVLSAFIDVGLDVDYLTDELKKLNIGNFSLDIKKVKRNGISATKLEVKADKGERHRSYNNIAEIIDKSSLGKKVKELSKNIFYRLALAESKVHNIPLEKVHFHEVGAVDSIIDIVGSAVCINHFDIEKVFSSHIKLGMGTTKSAHGIIPVPAPATLELVKDYPVIKTNIQTELTTPTGAAILTTISDGIVENLNITFKKIGYGAGSKEIEEIPNVIRIIIGKTDSKLECDEVLLVETNIDDLNPEIFPYVIEKLVDNNAIDVYITPIIMKKGRPGNILSVICKKENLDTLAEIIFEETSTIGLRIAEFKRLKLKREIIELDTEFGRIKAKKIYINDKEKIIPEYEECKKIAQKNNIPLKDIYNIINSQRK